MSTHDNKAQKTVIRIFFAWQDREEERWLEEMAAQGWLLEKYTFLRYHFTAIQPTDYIYRLDYKTTTDKDMAEYKDIFAQSGWEHVCSYMGWQYLRIPREKFSVDIYSDKASLLEKLRRMFASALMLLIPLFIVVVVLNFGSLENTFERYNLGFMNILMPILFVLMILGMISNFIWILKLSKRIKDLEKEVE
jgi:hypothetical protein